MAGLLANAVDGLLGAIVTGAFGAVALWWTRRNRKGQLEDAWKQQADELDDRLSTQYEQQIGWLKAQLKLCQQETQRLNKLIGRIQRSSRDD